MSGTGITGGTWEPAGLHAQGLYANDGSCMVLATQEDGDRKAICAVQMHAKAKRGEAYQTACAERDANLALICAAPALLEALTSLLDWMAQHHPEARKNCQEADAAVAKASLKSGER